MSSVWIDSVTLNAHKNLQMDITTDIAIIGGGMAGILTAFLLKSKGVDCVVIEANKVGLGVTKNTTAKITSQHGLIYDTLIRSVGQWKAKQYLSANEHALSKYKELCKNIDCDFHEKSAFVYSLNDKEKIKKEVAAVNSLNFPAKFKSKIELPFHIAGAIEFSNQAEFNPLKFINEISKSLTIYENTMVKSIKDTIIHTDHGKVTANKILVATHFPFINAPGYYFMKMYQQRSYVVALQNAQNLNGLYIDESDQGFSFRNYGDLLFIGGGGHRTGKKGGGYETLRDFAKELYPKSEEKFAWATQDCMTLDHIPYIGQYSKNTPNLFVATGFNKWGMTSSMVSAMLLSNIMMGAENHFEDLFSPQRFTLNKQFLINGLETTTGLLNLKTKRCSHLGCALNYNKQEHTWDCPCHGSRFEENGKLIDNPAIKDSNITQ
ncbi:MAG: FAD-dependent oxidoreductase [Oscillospiraceae bacterium]